MRAFTLFFVLLLAICCPAQAESSGQTFGLEDFPALEAISRRVPGFAGIARTVSSGESGCLRIGTVFPGLARQTLEAVRNSGLFGTAQLCPEVEFVPHSLRTLTRVARQVQAGLPALPVSIDTGLNRVLVPDVQVVLASFPNLAPYLVSEREIPPYILSLYVEQGVAWIRIYNPIDRRIAVEAFCGAPSVKVWRETKLLQTLPEVARALAGQPTILLPGGNLVLKGVMSTPLSTLPSGTYVLRVATDDQPPRKAQLKWEIK